MITLDPLANFDQVILQNWAAYFHCPLATLTQPGATLAATPRFAGDHVIVLTHIAEHTFVEFDPAYAPMLERLMTHPAPRTSLTAADIVTRLGADVFEGQDLNLMHYLYPPDLAEVALPAGYTLRQLARDDADAMAALHAANPPTDVDDGYVEVTHEVAFGCFRGTSLVAATSGYRRAGFMDIGVLTHPAHRRLGLGRAAVHALCAWSVAHNIIAQYRCNTTNPGSLALAASLSFRLYFHSEVLWLLG